MTSGKRCLAGWVTNPLKNPNIQSLDWGKRKRSSHPAKAPFRYGEKEYDYNLQLENALFPSLGALNQGPVHNASVKLRQGNHFLDLLTLLAKGSGHTVSRGPLKGVRRRSRVLAGLWKVCAATFTEASMLLNRERNWNDWIGFAHKPTAVNLNSHLGKLQLLAKCFLHGTTFLICWFPYLGLKTSKKKKALYNELLVRA